MLNSESFTFQETTRGMRVSELIGALNICKHLLQDSEKILPSAVRCIGFVADAIPLDPVVHREILSLLLSNVLRSSSAQDDPDIALIEERIISINHKLAFSIAQALGYIGKIMSAKVSEYIPEVAMVKNVLCLLMKHGKPKVQLQACKGLANISRLDTSALVLATCLDSALIVTHSATTLVPEMYSGVHASDETDLDGSLLEMLRSAERQALKRPVSLTVGKTLKTAMLVLISALFEACDFQSSSSDCSEVLVVILYHVEFLVDWLEVMSFAYY